VQKLTHVPLVIAILLVYVKVHQTSKAQRCLVDVSDTIGSELMKLAVNSTLNNCRPKHAS